MTSGTPLPGSMTVPPLHGWENIVVVLVVLVLSAVAVGVLLSLGRAETGRSEWQAWLDGRSAGQPEADPGIRPEARPVGARPGTGDGGASRWTGPRAGDGGTGTGAPGSR